MTWVVCVLWSVFILILYYLFSWLCLSLFLSCIFLDKFTHSQLFQNNCLALEISLHICCFSFISQIWLVIFFSKNIFIHLFLCVCIFVCMCIPCVQYPWIPWNLCYRLLVASMWLWEIEPETLGRVASAHNHRLSIPNVHCAVKNILYYSLE